MKKQTKKPKRKSLTRTRIVFWSGMLVVALVFGYFMFQPSASVRNQCENLPYYFMITLGNQPVGVQVVTADIEVSANGFTLHPYAVDAYGHRTYSISQEATGTVLLNQLDTVKALQNNYAYSRTMNFPTSPSIYRGSITTANGIIPDALYFIERTELAYTSCVTATST